MTQIEQRNPRALRPHPDIVEFPRWPTDSEGFRAFCNDIRDYGIQHPLQITAGGLVLDGETRRLAALAIGLETVPCLIVPDDDQAAVIVRELIQRRNLTQSAKAYWVYPTIAAAHDAAKQRWRRLRNGMLRKGQVVPPSDPSLPESARACVFGKIEEFCEFLGISRRLFEYSAKVHEIFDLDPSYKAQMLPEINEHGIGLGAVVAGWAGQKATKGKARQDDPEELRFRTCLHGLAVRISKLPDLGVIRDEVANMVRKAKEEDCDRLVEFSNELRAQLRARMQPGKEGK